MNFFGKWYKSIGGLRCRYWYFFTIQLMRKHPDIGQKKIGYWNMYYDGYYHFFNIWPIQFHWFKAPITERHWQDIKNIS